VFVPMSTTPTRKRVGRFAGMATRTPRAPADTSAIDDIELLDVDGNSVRLGSLWADEPVLAIWIRHYG
jgi:hypothetical protein